MRDANGRTTYGQGCLLARRLVEVGVKFVTVYFAASIGGRSKVPAAGTRTAQRRAMYPILNDYLLPISDQTLPTLIEDLHLRGPSGRHAGRLGRRVRPQPAHQHHRRPRPLAAMLHGPDGRVASKAVTSTASATASAAYPSRDPVRPEDLSATMFTSGIDRTPRCATRSTAAP